MNEQQMDKLVSVYASSSELRSALRVHPDNTSNTDNKRNTENTDNTTHTSYMGKKEQTSASNESRFCTIVEVSTLHKIRIIAKREGLQIKEVVGAAFLKAIQSYESKHGKIDGSQQNRADNLF